MDSGIWKSHLLLKFGSIMSRASTAWSDLHSRWLSQPFLVFHTILLWSRIQERHERPRRQCKVHISMSWDHIHQLKIFWKNHRTLVLSRFVAIRICILSILFRLGCSPFWHRCLGRQSKTFSVLHRHSHRHKANSLRISVLIHSL